MSLVKPPFRADHVGSLLRSPALKEARARRAAGEITPEALAAVEDREIEALIAKQAAVGLHSATDGEFRRSWWHFDFLQGLNGVQVVTASHGIAFQGGVQSQQRGLRVDGRIGFPEDHPFLNHFRFLRDHTKAMPKMTIPSPSVLHFRGGREAVSPGVYPDMEQFFTDLGDAYHDGVQAFAKAGCRYLQLDEVNFAYLCDDDQRAMLRERGDDPEKLPAVYASLMNRAIENRPADMTITTHLCRGNFKSSWIARGGYERVAELLFNSVNVDAYFMEWDTERAGGFEPLRFLPKGPKRVVLGLVTSKSGDLESKDDLKRRIDEASRFAPIEQLCLSPQCGFSSTEDGNILTEDAQWAKLRTIVEVAEEVWGSAGSSVIAPSGKAIAQADSK